MKRILSALAFFFAAICANAATVQYDGECECRNIPIMGDYTSLEVSGDIEVIFSSEYVIPTLCADKSIMPFIEVKLEDKCLKAGFNVWRVRAGRNKCKGRNHATVLKLPVNKGLTSIDLEDGASIVSMQAFTGKKLSLDLEDNSSFKAEVNVAELDVELSDDAVASTSGAVQMLKVDAEGGSFFQSEAQKTIAAEVNFSDASHGAFFCNGSIEGTLSGATVLNHYGKADTSKVIIKGTARLVSHK